MIVFLCVGGVCCFVGFLCRIGVVELSVCF